MVQVCSQNVPRAAFAELHRSDSRARRDNLNSSSPLKNQSLSVQTMETRQCCGITTASGQSTPYTRAEVEYRCRHNPACEYRKKKTVGDFGKWRKLPVFKNDRDDDRGFRTGLFRNARIGLQLFSAAPPRPNQPCSASRDVVFEICRLWLLLFFELVGHPHLPADTLWWRFEKNLQNFDTIRALGMFFLICNRGQRGIEDFVRAVQHIVKKNLGGGFRELSSHQHAAPAFHRFVIRQICNVVCGLRLAFLGKTGEHLQQFGNRLIELHLLVCEDFGDGIHLRLRGAFYILRRKTGRRPIEYRGREWRGGGRRRSRGPGGRIDR